MEATIKKTLESNEISGIAASFIKNRAEELGFDVWDKFVIPPFFNTLKLYELTKPCVIIGGRGCGKTMLLRYLSHNTAFSVKRNDITRDNLKSIGLYWRADTQFMRIMQGGGIANDIWCKAFNHFLFLQISIEIISSIESISNSSLNIDLNDYLNSTTFKSLNSFNINGNLYEIKEELESKKSEFEFWVNNINEPYIKFYPLSHLNKFIAEIQNSFKDLSDTIFQVYIDEYENLNEYQQEIINTLIKHSELPLIYNIAIKKNSFKTKKTVGEESISNIADFRQYDIDDLIKDNDFNLFAAEIMLLKLYYTGIKYDIFNPDIIRDPCRIDERRDSNYKTSILNAVQNILPSLTHNEHANNLLNDNTVYKKLTKIIDESYLLKDTDYNISDFIDKEHPEASIIQIALLNRKELNVNTIKEELNKYIIKEKSKFTNWIHNNLLGCFLLVYESLSKPCPIYSGFETFCLLSRGNLRHFLELCHQSFNTGLEKNEDGKYFVSIENQSRAAENTSIKFLDEVKSFGNFGNKLSAFTIGLGSLFALAHKQLSQSEPERNHFIIKDDDYEDDEIQEFLAEAEKWSVLIKFRETKVKDPLLDVKSYEYLLNPIYSPFFNISYRKKRKFEITIKEFKTLISGKYKNIKYILKEYSKKYEIDIKSSNPKLFSHMLWDNDD